MTIGFIGQGFIGKSYANDFERRGYRVVRYALEEPYRHNGDKLKGADIVFVAVPTPTTPKGFDDSIVRSAIAHAPAGSIVVIKSTILPGTTVSIQKQYPNRIILYSPEFLSEATAAKDAAHPFSNIVGKPVNSTKHARSAALVHKILPKAPYTLTCSSTEAEVIKYTHNGSGYVQIIFFNEMYDLARALGCKWTTIEEAILHDPLVCNRYARPVHKSGRGAGGHCFIKDFAALCFLYESTLPHDAKATAVFKAMEAKNIELLQNSGKDLDLLRGVYGKAVFKKNKHRARRTKA